MLSKEYLYRVIRECTTTREMLAKTVYDKLVSSDMHLYMEADLCNGIVRTCSMLTRTIKDTKRDIKELYSEK